MFLFTAHRHWPLQRKVFLCRHLRLCLLIGSYFSSTCPLVCCKFSGYFSCCVIRTFYHGAGRESSAKCLEQLNLTFAFSHAENVWTLLHVSEGSLSKQPPVRTEIIFVFKWKGISMDVACEFPKRHLESPSPLCVHTLMSLKHKLFLQWPDSDPSSGHITEQWTCLDFSLQKKTSLGCESGFHFSLMSATRR